MADGKAYGEAMMYEIFIRRAHKCERGTRNGADVAFMTNLMDTESGSNVTRHIGSFDKQLIKLKDYLNKAFDKFLRMKLTEQEKFRINFLKDQVFHCNSSNDVMEIVKSGLDVTQRFM